MGTDFSPLLAILLVVWGTLVVGIIPVLMAWLRIAGESQSPGPRVVPKALSTLTASICVVQVGNYICRALTGWTQGTFRVYLILYSFFALGFLLNLAALVFALRERSAARGAILIGSVGVAVVNVLGLGFLIATAIDPSLFN